jgi:hypothetical protein
MLDRLEKLDGSKRPKAIVLATLPGGDDDQAESDGFRLPTPEEWEREFNKPDPEGGATAAMVRGRGQK